MPDLTVGHKSSLLTLHIIGKGVDTHRHWYHAPRVGDVIALALVGDEGTVEYTVSSVTWLDDRGPEGDVRIDVKRASHGR